MRSSQTKGRGTDASVGCRKENNISIEIWRARRVSMFCWLSSMESKELPRDKKLESPERTIADFSPSQSTSKSTNGKSH